MMKVNKNSIAKINELINDPRNKVSDYRLVGNKLVLLGDCIIHNLTYPISEVLGNLTVSVNEYSKDFLPSECDSININIVDSKDYRFDIKCESMEIIGWDNRISFRSDIEYSKLRLTRLNIISQKINCDRIEGFTSNFLNCDIKGSNNYFSECKFKNTVSVFNRGSDCTFYNCFLKDCNIKLLSNCITYLTINLVKSDLFVKSSVLEFIVRTVKDSNIHIETTSLVDYKFPNVEDTANYSVYVNSKLSSIALLSEFAKRDLGRIIYSMK